MGGSQQHRPSRVRKPGCSQAGKVNGAIERAKLKVGGEETYAEIQNSWSSLKTGNHEVDQERGNGIIINLLNLG